MSNENWFLENIRRAEELKAVAEEYSKITSEIKKKTKEIATKKNNGLRKTTSRPEKGKVTVTMDIGGEFELIYKTHQRPAFKVPAHVKAKYEVDPTTVEHVNWEPRCVVNE